MMMPTKGTIEQLKQMNEATNCFEYLAALDIEFPAFPENLELKNFIKFEFGNLKVFKNMLKRLIHILGLWI